MSEELKPCPCCYKTVALEYDYPYEGFVLIRCNALKDGCGLSSGGYESEEEVIELWNTRYIPEGYKLVNKQVNMESKLADTLADIMDYPTYTDATNIQRVWSDLLEATE